MLELNLNGWRDQSLGKQYRATTDLDGSFQLDLSQENIIAGWNWVFASAECEPWWGTFTVQSEGYAEFKYTPVVAVDEGENGETFDEVEVEEQPYIPPGAILLPDFTGQPLDDAIDWLEANGFGYTWIDGSSTYDLGLVYDQAPAGGKYKVPHRTVVVLYRTTSQESFAKALIGEWQWVYDWECDGEFESINNTLFLHEDGIASVEFERSDGTIDYEEFTWSFFDNKFELHTSGESIYQGIINNNQLEGNMSYGSGEELVTGCWFASSK